MTATTTTGLPDHYELALGHPVRSFVLTLVGLAIALLVLQWSGFVYPDVHAAGSGSQDLGDGAQTFTVAVENGSPLPVEIVGIEWPTTGMTSAELGIAPSETDQDGSTVHYVVEPFEPFVLEGGETAWFITRVVAAECSAALDSPTVEVRTASGLLRHIDLDQPSAEVQGPCP